MICYHLTHASSELLLDLLKATGLIMVCNGNVSSMRHIYGKSLDSTFFLKTNARKSRSQWLLNCICTDSLTPRCVHKSNGIPRIYARGTIFSRSDGSGKGA